MNPDFSAEIALMAILAMKYKYQALHYFWLLVLPHYIFF
jgi:hypothetical protein